jgi:multiple sugar transport system substrate-binding protein
MRPLDACYREYERQNPGIRIVYQQSTISDYMQTVMTARLAGTSPDIYNVYSLWAGQMIEAGLLAEPPAGIRSLIRDNYLPSTAEGVQARGKPWGIPAEISTYMLVYNKQLLKQAGYEAPPQTWEELRQIAAKITRRNGQNNITTAGYAFGPTVANAVHPFMSLLMAQGVTPIKPDASGTGLGSPEAVAVLTGMSRLFTDGTVSNAVTVRDFPSGTVGMAIIANWFKDTLRQGMGDRFEDLVGVAPIPTDAAEWRTLQYSFFWGVDARSRNKDQAWDLLRWLNTPQALGARSCTGEMLLRMGALTGNKADIAASSKELGDDFSRPYVEALSSGRAVALPNLQRMTEIQQALRNNIEKAWSGSVSPAQALRQADREIRPLLAEDR